MAINAFQVRLKDEEEPNGFREGLVGTVIDLQAINTPEGIKEVCKTLWFNYDEETGETTVKLDAPAPSTHFPTELVAFVDNIDELDDIDEEDEDEEEDEEDEDTVVLPGKNSNVESINT